MKVLIGITSKNRAKILPKAIESALAQSYVNKEIWVFDDASTDSTKLLKDEFPNVHWIISEEPKGLVWARNLFMQQEGYDLFCSLDDDAWFLNDTALEKAIDSFENDKTIGALGFDMLSPDQPDIHTQEPYLKETNIFIGCGHIIRLTAAEKINYYTLNPGYYGSEEKDLCIRMLDQGYKIIKYHGMYVWHDKTNLSRDLKLQHRSGVCNDLVFSFRRTPNIYLLPALLVKFIKHLKFSLMYKKERLTIPCLLGFKDFITWLIRNPTNRKPVSIKSFKTFLDLN